MKNPTRLELLEAANALNRIYGGETLAESDDGNTRTYLAQAFLVDETPGEKPYIFLAFEERDVEVGKFTLTLTQVGSEEPEEKEPLIESFLKDFEECYVKGKGFIRKHKGFGTLVEECVGKLRRDL